MLDEKSQGVARSAKLPVGSGGEVECCFED